MGFLYGSYICFQDKLIIKLSQEKALAESAYLIRQGNLENLGKDKLYIFRPQTPNRLWDNRNRI